MSHSEFPQDSELEERFHKGAVVAALLSIPAIFMQASGNHFTHAAGNTLNIFVWLFFIVEVTVLIRLAPDNWAWARKHKLEVSVVIGTAPVFSLIGERGTIFGMVPLLMIVRVIRFAKFMKLGKLLKTVKIIKNDDKFPKWIDPLVFVLAFILAIGIFGMIIDSEAHSIDHGLKYWYHLFHKEARIEKSYLYLSFLVIFIPLFAIFVKRKKTVEAS